MKYIKNFDQISIVDIGLVGGKNASLGEMIVALKNQNIRVPDGYAITADAYWHYLKTNQLIEPLKKIMAQLKDSSDISQLQKVGKQARELIKSGIVSQDLADQIVNSYKELSQKYNQENCDVAVRSSATAEDLPTASFAGQQETYLNVQGEKELLESYINCLASLFTDRAIVYRIEQGFDHFKIALSVGVQKMIRSDRASSGVAFSLDPETGFKDVVVINAAYGLGESIVQGLVVPDEFIVHKQTFEKGFKPIIKKQLGTKDTKIIYADTQSSLTKTIQVTEDERKLFSLDDAQVLELAQDVIEIEKYYSQKKGAWTPMDIEWAIDGLDNKLYIIQARPETIHANNSHKNVMIKYVLEKTNSLKIVASGQSIGERIATGPARVITNVEDIATIKPGEILVTTMTDPDWVPVMKKAAGIITDQGGRTCHAAIVSRELKLPAIVGALNATHAIKTGQIITLDCSQGKQGFVYDGNVPFNIEHFELDSVPQLPFELMVNIADPDGAFSAGMLPVSGVGLARIEFIISNAIQIHPLALLHPEKIEDKKVIKKIEDITSGYADKKQFFIDTLAQGIAMIAASFYPRKVMIRFSDFKSNEYRDLIGGVYFEPIEENPMIGFRGAARYYNEHYQQAFALECAAIKKVRDTMGFENVILMIPFVRTVAGLKKVLNELEHNGLKREQATVIMMCEVPSNVVLIEKFSELVDGFSIGSNDLAQLTLGVDRDSALLAQDYDERDEAVQRMLKMAIDGAKSNNKYIGICGQAPSDYPEIARNLIEWGISSISLNVDTVMDFLLNYK